MQTFLPSTDFAQSAKWLDNQRLGKQRVETLQILNALTDPSYGWQSHPAVKMWRGYEAALGRYGLIICEEWIRRGYKDTCYQKTIDLFDGVIPYQEAPPWLTEEFASNHRAVLLGKARESIDSALSWYWENVSDVETDKGIQEIYLKAKKKRDKAIKVMNWYQQWGWSEKPAERNTDSKWPYLWPEMTNGTN